MFPCIGGNSSEAKSCTIAFGASSRCLTRGISKRTTHQLSSSGFLKRDRSGFAGITSPTLLAGKSLQLLEPHGANTQGNFWSVFSKSALKSALEVGTNLPAFCPTECQPFSRIFLRPRASINKSADPNHALGFGRLVILVRSPNLS